jgi:signal transduction histidine kinase
MKTFRRLSIRHKLILLVLFICGSVLPVSSAFFIANELVTFRRGMLNELSMLAKIIANTGAAAVTFKDRKAAEKTMADVNVNRHIVFIGIYTAEGDLFAEYHRDKDLPLSEKKAAGKISEAKAAGDQGSLEGYPFFDDYLDVFENIVFETKSAGIVYIRAEMKEIYSHLKWYVATCGIILFFSFISAYYLSSKLQSVISQPIVELTRIMKMISGWKNYAVRAERKNDDELGMLTDGFNEMLTQIQMRDRQLDQQRENLEYEVAMRTAELAEANKGLKQTVAELKHAKEAAEIANRIKSEFLANMSHEIRTPLNAILGFAEVLTDKLEDSEQETCLKAIQLSGKALLALINDILDLSKIEAGMLEIQPSPADVRSLVAEIRMLFLHEFETKGLFFKSDINETVPETLLLDEARIRQILINLVGNAVKFTHRGGVEVRVRGEGSGLRGQIADNAVHFSLLTLIIEIADTGIGIPEDQLEVIFEKFRQQDGQSTRKYGGAGLGLAITKKLTEMMNGSISVQSRVGKGSVFRIVFSGVQAVSDLGVADKSGEAEKSVLKETTVLSGQKSAAATSDENILSPETLSRFSELISILEKELIPKWKEIRETLIFDETGAFAEQVKGKAEEYGCRLLKDWSENIKYQLQHFDIESLPDTFEQFFEITEKLKRLTADSI